MATCHFRQFNHIATPDELGFCARGYEMQVENLRLNDFRHAMRYYSYSKLIPNMYDFEWRLENAYMETQGSLSAFHQSINKYQVRPY